MIYIVVGSLIIIILLLNKILKTLRSKDKEKAISTEELLKDIDDENLKIEFREKYGSHIPVEQLPVILELNKEKLKNIEAQRQKIIDDGAKKGETLSTEELLKNVKDENFKREFREKYGSRVPVDVAYQLSKEIDKKT